MSLSRLLIVIGVLFGLLGTFALSCAEPPNNLCLDRSYAYATVVCPHPDHTVVTFGGQTLCRCRKPDSNAP